METISEYKRIRRRTGQAARRAGNKKEPATQRTTGDAADGFLKHRFLPLYEPSGALPEQQKTEKEFFSSLSILSGLYGLQPMDTSGKPYPYNLSLAHWDCSQQLNRDNQEVELSICCDEKDTVNLMTRQTFETGTTLYYIPVIPLYRLLQDRQQRPAAELLLSVFSYLYRIANVPYYRDVYSSMNYNYDMLKEWMIQDIDGEEQELLDKNISELNTADYCGDMIQRKIYNPYHLNHFKERIDRFKAKGTLQRNCQQVAKDAYNLYLQFPDRTIFHNLMEAEPDEDEYDNDLIRMEQYISFVSNNEGWVFENLEQMVNSEFNECGAMQQPCVIQVFDNKTDILKEGLGFEHRIFSLMSDLCTLLNTIP